MVTVLPVGATQDSSEGDSEPRVEPTNLSETNKTEVAIAIPTTPSPVSCGRTLLIEND